MPDGQIGDTNAADGKGATTTEQELLVLSDKSRYPVPKDFKLPDNLKQAFLEKERFALEGQSHKERVTELERENRELKNKSAGEQTQDELPDPIENPQGYRDRVRDSAVEASAEYQARSNQLGSAHTAELLELDHLIADYHAQDLKAIEAITDPTEKSVKQAELQKKMTDRAVQVMNEIIRRGWGVERFGPKGKEKIHFQSGVAKTVFRDMHFDDYTKRARDAGINEVRATMSDAEKASGGIPSGGGGKPGISEKGDWFKPENRGALEGELRKRSEEEAERQRKAKGHK